MKRHILVVTFKGTFRLDSDQRSRVDPFCAFVLWVHRSYLLTYQSYQSQSVTSRLETSRYRDFSQFFESIGLGLENFGREKKSRSRSRKKVSVSVSMKFFGLVTQ